MKLSTEFIPLPLRFDSSRMAEEISAFPERAWRPHPQGYPGNSALPLVAAYGDAANNDTRGPMRPTQWLRQCPYLQQVLASLDTVIGRTRLMRIDGNAEATSHVDTNYYWLQRMRVHIPIVTDPAVRFICGEKSIHMAAGETWVFDTWRTHNVINPNPTRRIHLVCDTVGSSTLWDRIERSGEEPAAIEFDPDRHAELQLETVNHPVVMSPSEQESLLAFLYENIEGDAGDLRARIRRFTHDWRSLWSMHGDAAAGWSAYAALRDELDRDLASCGEICLKNGVDAIEQLRQMIVRPAVNPDLAPRAPASRAARHIERPVFIVSSPRAGSTMLFEALAQSPGVYTVGGESHAVIEGIEALSPASRGYDSNRLTAEDAMHAKNLGERFYGALRNRDGVAATGTVRMLEKTPKNSLRIPFLRALFPGALFIYLYRDPRATISSMLDAWRSGRFVTYPNLPGWDGPPWSLLLVPGWQELSGRELAEIVATQWATATRMLLDDLEALPPEQWCVAAYDQVVNDPQREIKRLCEFVGIAWDRELTAPLPLSRYTLTPPDREKVERNQVELAIAEPMTLEVAERAREVFARPPAQRMRAPQSKPVPDAAAFRSVSTPTFAEILSTLGASLVVTTYQSGRVVLVRAEDAKKLNTHLRMFESPMGVAATPRSLAIGTRNEVRLYRNQPDVASKLDPPERHDACFVPRDAHVTGDVRIHEVAFAGDELWFVNTRFSALCTLDEEHSFVPRWRPPFVTHLAPEDRCHLNGMAIVDRRVRYVTALGETNVDNGWRDRKTTGGVVIDVDSGESVVRNLCMPHSPRWYGGRFWFLESGKGTLASADLATGKVETITALPGFTRGLAFAGPFAFVGLSQVRESNIFGGLPLAERVAQRQCGIWIVDLRTGQAVAFLRFEGSVEEIFDVQILHGMRYPELLEPSSPLVSTSYVLPQAAMADVAQ
jgi:uncharacterized protein (TIGR03032 family)